MCDRLTQIDAALVHLLVYINIFMKICCYGFPCVNVYCSQLDIRLERQVVINL